MEIYLGNLAETLISSWLAMIPKCISHKAVAILNPWV